MRDDHGPDQSKGRMPRGSSWAARWRTRIARRRLGDAVIAIPDLSELPELYRRAAAQLGHDDPAIRVAGVYALEDIARQWTVVREVEQRDVCIDALCGYLTSSRGVNAPPDGRQLPTMTAAEAEVRTTIAVVIGRHLRSQNPESGGDWSGRRYDFTSAHFAGTDGFRAAHFNRGALFEGSHFHQTAEFRWTYFHGPAGFGRASFHQAADFHGAHFDRSAMFAEAHFVRDGDLSQAHILGSLDLMGTEGRLTLTGAQLLAEHLTDDLRDRGAVELPLTTSCPVCRDALQG